MILRFILFGTFMLISALIFFQYWKATKEQNGVLVATTFNYDQLNDERVLRIRDQVRRELKIVFAVVSLVNSSVLWFGHEGSDYVMFLAMLIPLFSTLAFVVPIARGFYDLRALKAIEGWTVGETKKISVDISLSAKGDRQALSPKYFIFPLVLLMAEIIFFMCTDQSGNSFAILWIGIGILISDAALYTFYRRRKNRAYTKDENLNEKINEVRKGKTTEAIFLLSVIQTIWFGFCFYSLAKDFYNSEALIIYFLGMSISFVFIYLYLNKLDERASRMIPREIAILSDEDEYYDLLGYKNPNDPRLFVEPRIGSKMDINRGHWKGKLLFYGNWAVAVLFLSAAFIFFGRMQSASFDVTIEKEKIIISAPLYGVTIEKKDLKSVKWLERLPEGRIIRTNGYGGFEKSYGKFDIEGIGPVKLYLYTKNLTCIRLETEKEIIYINEPTQEETTALYHRLTE